MIFGDIWSTSIMHGANLSQIPRRQVDGIRIFKNFLSITTKNARNERGNSNSLSRTKAFERPDSKRQLSFT
jgi:hypothetical protein